ncbi:MAG: DUF4190 domain-containing protein [Planctomycetales bacterium]|nr:DUF4190 domain-containing protein [Planctomycetales bacterium]
MNVACSQCGEELIGSVNRCWRCGQTILSTSDSLHAPPVRAGEAAAPDAIPVAYLVPKPISPDSEAGNTPGSEERDSGLSDAEREFLAANPEEPVRRGSPFRQDAPGADSNVLQVVMPSYPENVLGENLAISSVVVGIMSLVATLITSWALIPAAIGLALGIMGLKSDRRRTAIVGIVISALAISFGTIRTIGAVQTYLEMRELEQMDSLMDY